MGWSTGSTLMSDIIEQFEDLDIDDDTKKKIYTTLIESFSNFDCDTLDECVGVDNSYDEAYKELYPLNEEDYEDEDTGC